jgi:transposase-like protein
VRRTAGAVASRLTCHHDGPALGALLSPDDGANRVARDLDVNDGTLGKWVNRAREAAEGTRGLSKGDVEELKRLRAESAATQNEFRDDALRGNG